MTRGARGVAYDAGQHRRGHEVGPCTALPAGPVAEVAVGATGDALVLPKHSRCHWAVLAGTAAAQRPVTVVAGDAPATGLITIVAVVRLHAPPMGKRPRGPGNMDTRGRGRQRGGWALDKANRNAKGRGGLEGLEGQGGQLHANAGNLRRKPRSPAISHGLDSRTRDKPPDIQRREPLREQQVQSQGCMQATEKATAVPQHRGSCHRVQLQQHSIKAEGAQV